MILRAPAGRATFLNEAGLKFIRISAGRFLMGSTDPDAPENERPAHIVELSRPFWLAETPVTNAQYERFDPDHIARLG